MTSWDFAMVGIFPLMRGRQKLRTWLTVICASLATFFVHDPVGYMAIDAIAAAVVMARPAGLPQRAIGAVFVWMLMLDLGFYFSPHEGWGLFVTVSTMAAWVQWLILGAWAGHDIFRRYLRWADPDDSPQVAYERRVR